jgi:hypothetical protein
MDRRKMLVTAAAATGASVLPHQPAAAGVSALDVLLPAGPEAERLGRRVLERHPRTAAAGRALAASLEVACGTNPETIRGAFADHRAVQLAALDTCVVDGWVLARCEAEICAARADLGLQP